MSTSNRFSSPARWFAALTMSLSASIASAQIAFVDVAHAAGVDRRVESYGASFGDFNGDGLLDIYANNHRVQDSLFLNRGNNIFYETASQIKPWVFRPTADTHGASFADIDNDGDQDLVISAGINTPMELLMNEYGRMVDRTVQYALPPSTNSDGHMPVFMDYNRDGKLDLMMVYAGAAKLLQQNPNTTNFINTTTASKIACTQSHYGQLIDVTEDGRVDFLCPADAAFPQKLYNFTPFPWQKVYDVTAPTSLFPVVPNIVDSVNADFNNDGRIDTFVLSGVTLRASSVVQSGSNYFEAHLAGGSKGFKFITQGTVTFAMDWNKSADGGTGQSLTKIQVGANAVSPTAIPFTLDPTDPNVVGMPPPPQTDADLPVMQIGYDPAAKRWTSFIVAKLTGKTVSSEAFLQITTEQPLSNLTATGLWPTDKAAAPTLLMNNGNRTNATVAAGLSTPVQCISVVAGDFDNDMDIDLYLACHTGASNIANILYENQGDGTFVATPNAGGAAGVTGVAIASGAGTADSVVVGDYNVDGFLDLFVTNGFNLRPLGFGGPNQLFQNQGNANRWIELDLVGTASDRDATGARVTALAGGVSQLRVQDGGYHRWSQNAKRIHFGLAGNTTVTLQVQWPSGVVENFNDVPANALYRLTEGSGIAAVSVGTAPAYICGPPAITGTVDRGIFLWRDCISGEWRMKTASAGGSVTYQGTMTSSAALVSVKPQGTAATDTVDYTTNPNQLAFTFVTKGASTKGVNFTTAEGSSNCMSITAPAGVNTFMGPFKTPVSQPFNLDTQQTCP